MEEVPETNESKSFKETPKVSEAPKVSAYKPKVSFPTRLK